MVKGYKALSPNMAAIYGNGITYELGKWYKVDGEIKPCENGFHSYCEEDAETDLRGDIGRRETGILDLYMLAFKLAQEQLAKNS